MDKFRDKILMSLASGFRFLSSLIKRTICPDNEIAVSLDDTQRAKMMAVTLAINCASVRGKLAPVQMSIISDWGSEQMRFPEGTEVDQTTFLKAVKKAAKFFNRNNRIDVCAVCTFINEVIPQCERYGILELCINVSCCNHALSNGQVALLKTYAQLFDIDMQRFRDMIEKYISLEDSRESNVKLILGIDEDMSRDQLLSALNEEFRKWNCRVTNQNPNIRKRADHMLKMIAEQRIRYKIIKNC